MLTKTEEIMNVLEHTANNTEDRILQIDKFTYTIGEASVPGIDAKSYLILSKDSENLILGNLAGSFICGKAHCPFSFFKKNPQELNKLIMDTWWKELKDVQMLARINTLNNIVRGFLYKSYTMVEYIDAFKIMVKHFPDKTSIDWWDGGDLYSSYFHIRILFNSLRFMVNNTEYRCGYQLKMSDTGEYRRLDIHLMLWNSDTHTYVILNAPEGNYYTSAYSDLTLGDLENVIADIPGVLEKNLKGIEEKIKEAHEILLTKENLEQMKLKYKFNSLLAKKFFNKFCNNFKEKDFEGLTLWKFITEFLKEIQEFPFVKKLKHEQIASIFMDLFLMKL